MRQTFELEEYKKQNWALPETFISFLFLNKYTLRLVSQVFSPENIFWSIISACVRWTCPAPSPLTSLYSSYYKSLIHLTPPSTFSHTEEPITSQVCFQFIINNYKNTKLDSLQLFKIFLPYLPSHLYPALFNCLIELWSPCEN